MSRVVAGVGAYTGPKIELDLIGNAGTFTLPGNPAWVVEKRLTDWLQTINPSMSDRQKAYAACAGKRANYIEYEKCVLDRARQYTQESAVTDRSTKIWIAGGVVAAVVVLASLFMRRR